MNIRDLLLKEAKMWLDPNGNTVYPGWQEVDKILCEWGFVSGLVSDKSLSWYALLVREAISSDHVS